MRDSESKPIDKETEQTVLQAYEKQAIQSFYLNTVWYILAEIKPLKPAEDRETLGLMEQV